MKDSPTKNTAVTIPVRVIAHGKAKAVKKYGKRGFSRYVTDLITADLARK